MGGSGAVKYPHIILKLAEGTDAFHLVTSVCRSMVRAGVDRQIVAEAANAITGRTVTPEEYLAKAREWITITLVKETDEENKSRTRGDAGKFAALVSATFGETSSAVSSDFAK